jgi:hypothetical protein
VNQPENRPFRLTHLQTIELNLKEVCITAFRNSFAVARFKILEMESWKSRRTWVSDDDMIVAGSSLR